jgi:hypothetical protein
MFVAVAVGNGATSGLKNDRTLVEDWARNQLNNTKATNIYILEAVAEFHIAPRAIIEKDLRQHQEPKADVKCEECVPTDDPTTFFRRHFSSGRTSSNGVDTEDPPSALR